MRHAQLDDIEILPDPDDVFPIEALNRLGRDMVIDERIRLDLTNGGDARHPCARSAQDIAQKCHVPVDVIGKDLRLLSALVTVFANLAAILGIGCLTQFHVHFPDGALDRLLRRVHWRGGVGLAAQLHIFFRNRGLRFHRPHLITGVGVGVLLQPAHDLPVFIQARFVMRVLLIAAHRIVFEGIRLKSQCVHRQEQYNSTDKCYDPP